MKKGLLQGFAVLLLAVTACKKENNEALSPDQVLTSEIMSAEEEILYEADVAFLDNMSTNDMEIAPPSIFERTSDEWQSGILADSIPAEPCATKTWRIIDSLHRVLVIDFGPEPCLCLDSIYRRGRVIIHFEGLRGRPGFRKTITHEGYFVNRNKIEGKITIVYQGDFKWTRTLENGLIVYPDGTRATRQSRNLIEQLEGMDTPGPRGDIFRITGSSNGVNRKGFRYVSNIREPLIRRVEPGCARVFVKGVVVTKTNNGNEAILDYDPDNAAPCDRVASLTINGETRIIRL